MKYISVDIETSGLNPERNQILSFAAIIEDTEKKLPKEECPSFYRIVSHHEITGSPFALNLNKKEIEIIKDHVEGIENFKYRNYMVSVDGLAKDFYHFLWENGFGERDIMLHNDLPEFNSKTKPIYFNVAGKNFGTFDKLFLEKLPWWKKIIKTRNRILDPGILFLDWQNDDQIPSLGMCKGRANITGDVTHDALDDAWDVILVLRKFY